MDQPKPPSDKTPKAQAETVLDRIAELTNTPTESFSDETHPDAIKYHQTMDLLRLWEAIDTAQGRARVLEFAAQEAKLS